MLVIGLDTYCPTMEVISHINDIVDVLPHFHKRKPPEMPKRRRCSYGDNLAGRERFFELLEELEVVCAIRRQAKRGALEVCGLGWLNKSKIIVEGNLHPDIPSQTPCRPSYSLRENPVC